MTSVKEDDETEMRMVYDPSHPDAERIVMLHIKCQYHVTEMTNLIDTKPYEANTTAFDDANKAIAQAGLQIGRSRNDTGG